MATLGIGNPIRFTNIIQGYSTTVTAAGITTLTSLSNYQQFFTGTTTQTIRLPLTTTLVNGARYMIVNQSTGTVTVQTNGGSAITTVATNSDLEFTCINNGVDASTSWSFLSDTISLTLGNDVTGPFATNTVDFIQAVRTVATTGESTSYNVGTASQSGFAVTGISTNWNVGNDETWINYSSQGANMPMKITSVNSFTSITAQRPTTIAATSYTLTSGNKYYAVNSAQQTGTTVTGTGTTFTPDMVGGTLTFFGSYYFNGGGQGVEQTGTTVQFAGPGSPGTFTPSMAPGYLMWVESYAFWLYQASQTGYIVTVLGFGFYRRDEGSYILWSNGEISYIVEVLSGQHCRVANSRTIALQNFQKLGPKIGSTLITGYVNSTTLTAATVSTQTQASEGWILFYNNGTPTRITGYNSPTSLTVDTSQTIASCNYMIQYANPVSRISFGSATPNSSNACIGIGSGTFPSFTNVTSNSVGVGRFAGINGSFNQVSLGYQSGYYLPSLSTSVGCLSGVNSTSGLNMGNSDAFGSLAMYPHTQQLQKFNRCFAFGSQLLTIVGGSNFFSDDNNAFGRLNFDSLGLKTGTGNVCMGDQSMKYNYDSDYSVSIGNQAHFVPLGTRQTSVMTQTAGQVVTVATPGQPTMTPQMMGLTLRQPFGGYTADRRILTVTSTTVFTSDSGSNFTSLNAYPLFPTSYNVAIGANALKNVQSQYNVAVGVNALTELTVPSFTQGTASITTLTTAVTGVGTNWNVNWNVSRAYIAFGSTYPYKAYQIASINSPTSLTLSTFFAESTLSGSAYVLSLGGEAPGNIGIGFNSGSAITSGTGNILIGGYTGSTAPVNATGHDNIVISDPSGFQKLIMAPHTSRVYNSPTTINAASYTQLFLDSSLIFTTTNCTLTLLSASLYPGQTLIVKNVTANSVVSATNNVYPLGSNTLGTAILAAVAGRWAMLQSDGANWRIMMAN